MVDSLEFSPDFSLSPELHFKQYLNLKTQAFFTS